MGYELGIVQGFRGDTPIAKERIKTGPCQLDGDDDRGKALSLTPQSRSMLTLSISAASSELDHSRLFFSLTASIWVLVWEV